MCGKDTQKKTQGRDTGKIHKKVQKKRKREIGSKEKYEKREGHRNTKKERCIWNF